MKPMTKEEWDKKQQETRYVYDEETGRMRSGTLALPFDCINRVVRSLRSVLLRSLSEECFNRLVRSVLTG